MAYYQAGPVVSLDLESHSDLIKLGPMRRLLSIVIFFVPTVLLAKGHGTGHGHGKHHKSSKETFAVISNAKVAAAPIPDGIGRVAPFAVVPNQSTEHVRSYVTKDGKVVQPYYRTVPDNTLDNNFSARGNLNPFTGKVGDKPRDEDKPN